MMLMLSLGFVLGVLACVAADAVERLRKSKRTRRTLYVGPFFRGAEPVTTTTTRTITVSGDAFANSSPRHRAELAREIVDSLAQDSTLPAKDS